MEYLQLVEYIQSMEGIIYNSGVYTINEGEYIQSVEVSIYKQRSIYSQWSIFSQ